ncbi:MAG: adenylyltransferase/cytidyltransferase family protein [Minisyncoccia bacterium]
MNVKRIMSGNATLDERFTSNYGELLQALNAIRATGHTISMTQGVYDLLHTGHTRYLEEAKSHGDFLLVAVDTDAYTKRRKGSDNERRPVVPFQERIEILSQIRSVDLLTHRDLAEHETDPDYVIKLVRPNVLIMSHSTRDIDEQKYEEIRKMISEWGGRLELLQPKDTVSTTGRIRDLLIDGSVGFAEHIMGVLQREYDEYFHRAGRPFIHKEKDEK